MFLNQDSKRFVYRLWRPRQVMRMLHELRYKTHMVYLYTLQCSPTYNNYTLPILPSGTEHGNRRLLAQPSDTDALYDQIRLWRNKKNGCWSLRDLRSSGTHYPDTCTLSFIRGNYVLDYIEDEDQKNLIARLTKSAKNRYAYEGVALIYNNEPPLYT